MRTPHALALVALLFQPQAPAQARSRLEPVLRGLHGDDPAALPARVEALLRAEGELIGSFEQRLAEPSSRAAALSELEADDAELGAAVRAALPSGRADAGSVSRALEPWVARRVRKPVDEGLTRELAALGEQCLQAERSILRLAPGDPPIARQSKQEAAQRWDESRRRALAAIFDLLHYPDQDHGAGGQAEVDGRVGQAWSDYKAHAVRIEADLAPLFKKQPDEWKALLAGLSAARSALGATLPLLAARPGVRFRAPPEDDSARMHLARALVLVHVGRGAEAAPLLAEVGAYESELVRHVRAQLVLDHNAADQARNPRDPAEDKTERWINEYRIALGRIPLEHDARLLACARGHSQEMEELGYYEHESPVAEHRTFVDRARLAGYPEVKVGECILKGAPNWGGSRVGRAWYGSSTHHRLLLSEDFRQLGVGRSGPYFTANFGADHALGD